MKNDLTPATDKVVLEPVKECMPIPCKLQFEEVKNGDILLYLKNGGGFILSKQLFNKLFEIKE